MINLILACDENWCIGDSKNNSLPWHIPEDLKLFKRLTFDSLVVMGRKTFESIPEQYRPLPRRVNVVVCSNAEWRIEQERKYDKVIGIESIDDIPLLTYKHPYKEIFVIGGSTLYNAFLTDYNMCIDRVYISHIYGKHQGDLYFNGDLFYEHFTLEKTIYSHPKFHTNMYKRLS